MLIDLPLANSVVFATLSKLYLRTLSHSLVDPMVCHLRSRIYSALAGSEYVVTAELKEKVCVATPKSSG